MDRVILDRKPQTVSWLNDELVDWTSGEMYSLTGQVNRASKYHIGFSFDGAINSRDGVYSFIYQKKGTKGLLLKEGEILREIDRSYYCANAYEFPAAFLSYQRRTFLAHCPKQYCQLDFEDVETGELVTNLKSREPADFFHSRLEVSLNNEYLISKGWVWHPLDAARCYNVADCFADPKNLDRMDLDTLDTGIEVCTATFIDNSTVLVGTSDEVLDDERMTLPPKSFGIWDLVKNNVSSIQTPAYEFGNLFVINSRLAWDIYKFPKIIDLTNGNLVDKAEDVFSGTQRSAIFHDSQPLLAFNNRRDRLAVSDGDKIVVLQASL